MAESTPVRSGQDAWILQDHPKANRSSGDVIKLQNGERKACIFQPLSDIRGRTVLWATLTGHAKGSNPAQTLTAHMITGDWSAGAVHWPGPATSGVTGAAAIPATSGGDAVSIPITALLAQVALGAKWRGLTLTTSATDPGDSNWRSFNSGLRSWVLTYELSDAPTQPYDLKPDDGAVSVAKPILSWADHDLGGDSSDPTQLEVQVDAAQDGTSPDWTSGILDGVDPMLDLSTTSYPGLASGSTTSWRVRTYDATGNASIWSDWATFSYTPKPAGVLDSPTGGTIGDPSPAVLAHLATGTLKRYRVRATDGTDRTDVLYDTGSRPADAGTVDTEIPFRDGRGKRVIRRDGHSYQINVRMWDDVKRADAIGETSYVDLWATVTFDEGANEVPGDFTVVPAVDGSPQQVFSFTRSEAPEAVVLIGDGVFYDRVDVEDMTVDAGTYTWTDRAQAQPYEPVTWSIRAIDAGSRSAASAEVTTTTKPEGFWIIPDDGTAPIRLRGTDVSQLAYTEGRASYRPLNADTDVDIVYWYGGVGGTFNGTIDKSQPTTTNVANAVARLQALRTNPKARPRLVWTAMSIRAQLKNLSPLPSSEFLDITRQHTVALGFVEDPD